MFFYQRVVRVCNFSQDVQVCVMFLFGLSMVDMLYDLSAESFFRSSMTLRVGLCFSFSLFTQIEACFVRLVL